ncbi:MAG: glycosyltransferase [Clostridia bacterium]|nr:glycosyltransferase [Clostridia bacterium]
MKILITSDLYTTATNGVVTSLKNLCGELEKKGHEVRILSFSNNKHSRKEGNVYLLRSLPFPVYPDVRLPIFARRHEYVKEIIAWKPDVIHSQCEYFSFVYAKYI